MEETTGKKILFLKKILFSAGHHVCFTFRLFFSALVSALVGVLLLFTLILFVFVQHIRDPHILRTAPQLGGKLGTPLNHKNHGEYFLKCVIFCKSLTREFNMAAVLTIGSHWDEFGGSSYNHFHCSNAEHHLPDAALPFIVFSSFLV